MPRRLAILALASLLLVTSRVLGKAYRNSSAYSLGELGPAPLQSFYSSNLTPPALNLLVVPTPGTVSNNYTLLAYRGAQAVQPAPLLMDNDGELIWSGATYGSSLDLIQQSYLGQPVLTFFQGTLHTIGYGDGSWFLLNQNYQVIKSVTSQNQTANTTDFHEFVITANNTALIESWRVAQVDLTSLGGPVQGYTFDCVFQEVDLINSTLLFEWRSLEHVSLNESYFSLNGQGNSSANPYDYCHINSLEKDKVGNYLISLRGTSTIYYISGQSGDIIWRLGGKNSSFAQGNGTRFWYQHDARILSDITKSPLNLSLFDNAAGGAQPNEPTSRGLILSIDTKAMTSTLLHSYLPSFNSTSNSQGSLRLLENGTVFVGWGARPYWSEYTLNGTLLQDVQFGLVNGNNSVQTYRAFKMGWHGYPLTAPDFALNSTAGMAYASWNGATEVATWVLTGGNSTSSLSNVTSIPRDGFETALPIGGGTYQYLAAAAISSNGTCLGTSHVFAVANQSSVGSLGSCPGTAGSRWPQRAAATNG